jgi:uncharacterized protein YjlB
MNYINKYKVLNFKKHKNKIIDLIFKIPQTSIKNIKESIFHSDWEIPSTMKRDYLEYFCKNILESYLNDFKLKNNFKKVRMTNMWFQVYGEGDFHSLHTHTKTNFTNIFYIQLPSASVKTNIINYDVDVEEGDILSFPAFLKHGSPVNKSKDFKIIISFNIDVIE